jgi:hypothetical protein
MRRTHKGDLSDANLPPQAAQGHGQIGRRPPFLSNRRNSKSCGLLLQCLAETAVVTVPNPRPAINAPR